MRDIPGLPLIFIARSVMVLEPMALSTKDVMDRQEEGKLRNGIIRIGREETVGTNKFVKGRGFGVVTFDTSDTSKEKEVDWWSEGTESAER